MWSPSPVTPGWSRTASPRALSTPGSRRTGGWFAQDSGGNVWYFGELARELEKGEVTSTKGSWEAGVDGAQPGVIMAARPAVGLAYREEEYKGVAQDRAEVFSLRERVEVSGGSDRQELLSYRRGR